MWNHFLGGRIPQASTFFSQHEISGETPFFLNSLVDGCFNNLKDVEKAQVSFQNIVIFVKTGVEADHWHPLATYTGHLASLMVFFEIALSWMVLQASLASLEHPLEFTPWPWLSPISKASGKTFKGELHSSTHSASVVLSDLELWSSPERNSEEWNSFNQTKIRFSSQLWF